MHPIFLPKKKGRVSILTKNVSFETRPFLRCSQVYSEIDKTDEEDISK